MVVVEEWVDVFASWDMVVVDGTVVDTIVAVVDSIVAVDIVDTDVAEDEKRSN